jgi:hypothetical protein
MVKEAARALQPGVIVSRLRAKNSVSPDDH